MDSSIRCIALALMLNGDENPSTAEIDRLSRVLGVTTRSIYRYLDKIGRAKFLIKDVLAERMA